MSAETKDIVPVPFKKILPFDDDGTVIQHVSACKHRNDHTRLAQFCGEGPVHGLYRHGDTLCFFKTTNPCRYAKTFLPDGARIIRLTSRVQSEINWPCEMRKFRGLCAFIAVDCKMSQTFWINEIVLQAYDSLKAEVVYVDAQYNPTEDAAYVPADKVDGKPPKESAYRNRNRKHEKDIDKEYVASEDDDETDDDADVSDDDEKQEKKKAHKRRHVQDEEQDAYSYDQQDAEWTPNVQQNNKRLKLTTSSLLVRDPIKAGDHPFQYDPRLSSHYVTLPAFVLPAFQSLHELQRLQQLLAVKQLPALGTPAASP
jgi:hypothetical protein